MKRIIKLLSFCFIVICTGCIKPDTPPYMYVLKTFVSGYRCLEGINLKVGDGIVLVYKDDSGEAETMIEMNYSSDNSGYQKKLEELAVLHHDELDNPIRIWTEGQAEPPRIFIYPDFSAIHIAGEVNGAELSLDDVTKVYTVSCKRYIESGYKDEYDWSKSLAKDEEADVCRRVFEIPEEGVGYLFPVSGVAGDMDLEDLTLLGRDQSKDIPENADGKTYPFMALKINKDAVSKITVTLRGTDGNSYVGTLELK